MALNVEADERARAEYESASDAKRIAELEIYKSKNEKVLEILIVMGSLSKEHLDQTRSLVESMAI